MLPSGAHSKSTSPKTQLTPVPALFWHGGVGWFAARVYYRTADVGLSLDLRIKARGLVGAQLGYTVVGGAPSHWVNYGIHGGVAF